MSFYSDASLVMIPSGYKTSKVYSAVPTDGSGDLSFSRSNDTATRVNSAGLIEKVRTNLIAQSQNLSTAAWSLIGTATRTANYGIAPDGTQTSTRIQCDGVNAFELFQYTGVATPVYGSIYVKGTAGQTLRFNGVDKTLTGGWQRIEGGLPIDGANTYMTIQGYSGLTALDYEVWGAQAERGDIATDYIATTSAAVSVGPVANVPRLDYLNSSCPRLLLEPQRTNLVTNSENLGGAGWSSQGSTITSNATTSPDGYSNADAIVEAATTDEHNRIFNTTLTAASHTASVFLKKFNQTWCALYLFNGTVGIRHWINLDTLTAGTSANIGAGITAPLTLTNYGNGWVRASMTWTADATAWSFYIACARSNGGATTYAGDGTSGLYAWGAQVEAGAYATSYIPTLGAAVTRGADAASKTGISSLIGQTEGTLFVEVNFNGTGFGTDNDFLIYVGNGSNTNSMYIDYYNNLFRFVIFTGSSLTFYDDIATTNGTHKLALAYKSGSYAAYLDGVQIGVDTNATNPPTTSVFSLGGGATGFTSITKNTNQALLFKTRLTNESLAELTSL